MSKSTVEKIIDSELTTSTMDEVWKRIDLIASKIGTASEKIFEIYTKQAFIDGIVVSLFCLFVLIAFGWYVIREFRRFDNIMNTVKKRIETDKAWMSDNIKEICEDYSSAKFIYCIVVLIVIVVCTSYMRESLTSILNPEYMAFKMILEDIK